ncbi:pyridoxamine 5'-phosphate oxidase family protein [Streptomyces sp. SID486]|uniref:pyridoxamine 5'-phosphate oxidase family protein n=1 Tax=unclassified Streptomyces TaxID=2593676 RepID=UPI00136B6634|nr:MULTISPECIES: pyridoxamine 5'-phosphate oxidase family protein [unclassified Streptomyces]MYW19894.1 pyridoxamine 5'-phosphate oxidase family protein [Streptomyces sp. SID2955]MYW47762.1 pyridoxamine 5'-phosphate oxidase family protein [Streptomyces sp. SID161]MYX96729.1 pyridoxamine 5'-phosphate oxidase family protein [Streptomyces sp. SID486]
MTPPPARSAEQRKKDTLHRLENDVDAWVATAGPDGAAPCLVPLSFVWDGTALLIATAAGSATGRNLVATGTARLGIGTTRDVVLVDGAVRAVTPEDLPEEDAEVFAGKTGFDPRQLATPHLYFVVVPQRVRAWREESEPRGRELMRDGEWLAD